MRGMGQVSGLGRALALLVAVVAAGALGCGKGKPGHETPRAAAEGLIDALVGRDWQAFRDKLPADAELDAWCPGCREPLSARLGGEFRKSFETCAALLGGKSVKILDVRGGEDKGRKQRELRDGVLTASDLKVTVEVDGVSTRVEVDNPVIVGGRLHLLFLEPCR